MKLWCRECGEQCLVNPARFASRRTIRVAASRFMRFPARVRRNGPPPRVHFVLRFGCVEIRDSARKHRIADEDIVPVVEHALAVAELDADKTLHLGPDRAGNLLEVITVSSR